LVRPSSRTCVLSCWGRVCTPRLPPCCIRRIDRAHRSTTVHHPFHRTSLVLCPLAPPPAPSYLAFCGALATLSEGRRLPSHALRMHQLPLPCVSQITDIPYARHLVMPHPTVALLAFPFAEVLPSVCARVGQKEFKQKNSLSQHTGSTQVRTGAGRKKERKKTDNPKLKKERKKTDNPNEG